MRQALSVLLVCWVLGLATVAAADPRPSILIVQTRVVGTQDDPEPNLAVMDIIARELDRLRKVRPIRWSMTDEEVRLRVLDRTLPNFNEEPDERAARDAANRLGAQYLLVVRVYRDEGRLEGTAALFRSGQNRAVWTFNNSESDGAMQPIRVAGITDWLSTAESLARTMALQIDNGPLANLPSAPADVLSNQAGSDSPTTARFSPGLAFEELQTEANRLQGAGRAQAAITLLRQAIDSDPRDTRVRAELGRHLREAGYAELAALEMSRASRLDPGNRQLRLEAARSLLSVGRASEAMDSLNEALARGETGPHVDLLVAEASLELGRYEQASNLFQNVARAGLTEAGPDRHALALGSWFAAHLTRSQPPITPDRELGIEDGSARAAYRWYDVLFRDLSEDLRQFAPRYRLAQSMGQEAPLADLREQAERLAERATGLAEASDHFTVPERLRESHARWTLAHKLLAQAAQELVLFARNGDDDLALESAITLGESLRMAEIARIRFGIELGEEIVEATGS